MNESPTEQTPHTAEWLTRYVRDGDAAAFGALTQHYYPLVLAAALRRCDGCHSLAEDAAQKVFLDLARRASSLRADERLGGWLHQRAVRAAGDIMKSETRRRRREAVAAADLQSETIDPRWADAVPFIDAALQRLSARDRDAVLLRCVEGRDLRDVGTTLGLSADAAQKCVSRALEKLRSLLRRRGVVPALTAITAGLAADHARAAGFSGTAANVAARALQMGGAATTVPWLLHAKAAAAGAALACAAWAWPIAKSVRQTTAPAASSGGGAVRPVTDSAALRPLRFPVPPRLTFGLTVDELVARIAALAPLPDTESTKERFGYFTEQLMGERAGEALLKMRASYSASTMADVDRHRWRNYLLYTWAGVHPVPALRYAWACLPDDTRDPAFTCFEDALANIVHAQEKSDNAEECARWLLARLTECREQHPGAKFERILSLCDVRLVPMAVQSKSLATLALIAPVANEYRLQSFDKAADNTRDPKVLEMLASVAPLLDTPVRRAALLENTAMRLGEVDYAAARKFVENTENPDQRLTLARQVGLPLRRSSFVPFSPYSRDSYKQRADWLLNLAPPEKRENLAEEIAEFWITPDPSWTAQWVAAKLPANACLAWLDTRIAYQAGQLAGLGPGNNAAHALPSLLQQRRLTDPAGTSSFIEKLRTNNAQSPHAATLNALLAAP